MMIKGNPLWLWLFVIFVRAPVLLPFWGLSRAGEYATNVGDWLDQRLPGLDSYKYRNAGQMTDNTE
jgi:hypothetical protein